jgi:signal peptidase
MIKKIFQTIYYLFFVAITVVVLFLVLSAFPLKSGYRSFIVLSGSMEPKIHTGSVVAVKAQEEYAVGDVITFGENAKTKKPTTHRIFEIKEDKIKGEKSYVTKGDANNAPDQKEIKESEILGKVFLTIPYVGYAVSAAQKPIGFMLIVIVPAVILIYDEAQKIKKEILKKIDYQKRMKKRKENKEDDNHKEDRSEDNNSEDDDKKTQEKV